MDSTLFVLLGAGASFDASTYYRPRGAQWATAIGRDTRPPLVKELFDQRFDDILARYPMARNAAPDIRDAIAEGSGAAAVSLEDHLRTRYRDSNDELDRRRFYSLPLYLQEVLWSVSGEDDVPQADNLDRLVNHLLANFAHVCFVTLNYDLLLDRSLKAIAPLPSISSYITQQRWSLIKLHGSVTWGYRMVEVAGLDLSDPPGDLEERIDRDKIFHTWADDPLSLRRAERANEKFNTFPALSVPLGPEDELVCPQEHQEFLVEKLQEAGAIDLLVVGYSAFDQAVINVIREASIDVRSFAVVNADQNCANEVAVRLGDQLALDLTSPTVTVADDSFGNWARKGLRAYPDWVRSR
jgi:hypothetical protein